jgi:adenine-specific DNA-methyltransferase
MTVQATLLEAGPAAAGIEKAEHFRPIQYLGSKARLLTQIGATLDSVDPDRGATLDLFSGSGVVAAHLSRTRPVVAVDVQEYARVLAAAQLAPARMSPDEVAGIRTGAEQLFAEHAATRLHHLLRLDEEAARAAGRGELEPLCEILEHGSPAAFRLGEGPANGFPAEALSSASDELDALRGEATLAFHYGGVYFGYAQALQLDCLLGAIRSLPAGSARDTALAAALGAASEAVTSVGNHFAQPVRPRDRDGQPKPGLLASALRKRRRDPLATFTERMAHYAQLAGAARPATALRADYRAFLAGHPGEIAAVYADPPYTRDHYSRFYHVLETMALGDAPEISTVKIGGRTALSRGLYRQDRHQSPFCIRSQAPSAFEELFSRSRRFDAPVIVSYSTYSSGTAARPQPRLLRIPDIADIASEHFDQVTTRSAGTLSHSKFNARRFNGTAEEEAEHLIVCRP